MIKPLEQRFWEKVLRAGPEDCWLWTGARGPTTRRGAGGVLRHSLAYGYLRVKRDGRWVKEGAHRIALELSIGPLPPGSQAAHTCDVRLCCNPAHLFATDNLGNIADKVQKGRQSKGEQIRNHKMTVERVRDLRKLAVEGRATHAVLAEMFGISQTVASDIISRRTWKHVA